METAEKPNEIIAKPNVKETKKPLPKIEGKELVNDPFNLK